MTQRTRYFLVGSGLTVVVGLCTGLVAYYNGNLPRRLSTGGPAELTYVPADATALAYANVRHIMDSEFREKLRASLPTGGEKDKFLGATGIDVERDIDTVVVGLGTADSPQSRPIVLLRGRFDIEKIEAFARQHGATAEEHRGKRFLVADAAKSGQSGDHGAMGFLEPGLLVLGSPDGIRRAIDAADGANAESNAEMMKFVSGVANTSDAWVVGRAGALSNKTGIPQPIKDQLALVNWFALSADIDTTVTGQLRAEAQTAEAGDQMRAVVNGALAAGKMMANKDQRLEGMLSSLQASGTGQDVVLSFSVPPQLLEMFTERPGAVELRSGTAN